MRSRWYPGSDFPHQQVISSIGQTVHGTHALVASREPRPANDAESLQTAEESRTRAPSSITALPIPNGAVDALEAQELTIVPYNACQMTIGTEQ
jgi:hypothetical protein